ncbi:Nramp family divalent metal transporter [Planctomycetaceae bacterium]|jgi:Mn2+/Fe2+ NRAMP family transporter|nr:Nramp family divalent metal transporter [Planctomycetaceae bacterium]
MNDKPQDSPDEIPQGDGEASPLDNSEAIPAPTDFFGILKRLGPGLIIAGAIVGSGELIATTKTGAQAGITLLWLIILGCLIKVFVQIELGRYTITHGETTLTALNRVPGPRLKVNWIVWFWLFMMICTIGQLGGIVGGVGQSMAISIPITGDFREAIQIPSVSQINRYIDQDSYLLSEWDLRLSRNVADPEEISDEKYKTFEKAWLAKSIGSTRQLVDHVDQELLLKIDEQVKRLMKSEAGQSPALGVLSAPSPEKISARKELREHLSLANTKLLKLLDDTKELPNAVKYLLEMTPAQLQRALHGHAILAAELSDVNRDRNRGVAAAASAFALQQATKSQDDSQISAAKAFVAVAIEPATQDDRIWAGVGTLFTIILLWVGRYHLLQNISTILVVAFTLITIGNVISLQCTEQWSISLSQFMGGLTGGLPEKVPGEKDPLLTALATFGIIGVGATELITYPYWCLEKGYAKWAGVRSDDAAWAHRAKGWMRVMLYDAFLSMVVYTVATIAFYMMGVAVLFNEGRDPEGIRMVSTLASAYVPVFGEYAGWLFLIGAIAVLYSTFLVANAGNARMYVDGCKVFGLIGRDNPKTHDRTLLFFCTLIPLLSFSMYLTGADPVTLVLIAGMAQAVMLPMIGLGSLYFRYQMTDQRLRPSKLWDAMLVLSCLGLLITGIWGVVSRL